NNNGRHGPILNAGLEGLEIDLPDGLFVGEGGHMAAVVLLVVERKVLDVCVHALLSAGGGSLEGQLAGHEAVLGVVLKVAAGEGSTVDVHGGGIPAGDDADVGVVTPVAVGGQRVLTHIVAVEV